MTPPARLRVGTRDSLLARWQTAHVIQLLALASPGISFETIEIRTAGDRVQDVPLAQVGDRGIFTRDIDDRLRSGEIDLAVHSLKDLPVTAPGDLTVAAVLERDDPRDVLVSASRATLSQLPPRARVGTSSLRRRAQILAMREDLLVDNIRGNVPTRLAKVQSGEYAATVLAHAGLRRLGLEAAVSEVFNADRMLSAPGQGAIAVQVRSDDSRALALVQRLDHVPTRWATSSERAMLSALEGGCHAPVAALATWRTLRSLHLAGRVISLDGRRILAASAEAEVTTNEESLALGDEVATQLRGLGADAIVRDARSVTNGWGAVSS